MQSYDCDRKWFIPVTVVTVHKKTSIEKHLATLYLTTITANRQNNRNTTGSSVLQSLLCTRQALSTEPLLNTVWQVQWLLHTVRLQAQKHDWLQCLTVITAHSKTTHASTDRTCSTRQWELPRWHADGWFDTLCGRLDSIQNSCTWSPHCWHIGRCRRWRWRSRTTEHRRSSPPQRWAGG